MTTQRQSAALAWRHGVVSVEALGGMLGPTTFVLPDGRQVSPLQIAPWADEEQPGLPGILQRLRGEWPCVPFGRDGDRAAMGEWPVSSAVPTIDSNQHGFSSNNLWTIEPANETALQLGIAYPDAHPIAGLRRRITPDPEAAAIDIELEITARRDCDLPIGLHPVFRLPHLTGAMQLEVAGEVGAVTFPRGPDPVSIFAPDRYTADWHVVPLRDGTLLDPSRVPLARHTEEVLQLLDAPGEVALHNTAEGYRARLSWNRDHFPSLMFWFSNFGRQEPPWSGRHLALGVEPVCAALDLGPQISTSINPISTRGIPTARHFAAGETFRTRYRIAVEPA